MNQPNEDKFYQKFMNKNKVFFGKKKLAMVL